jgi:hypothetical protein
MERAKGAAAKQIRQISFVAMFTIFTILIMLKTSIKYIISILLMITQPSLRLEA